MCYWLPSFIFAICLAAADQTMTVNQLVEFFRSELQMGKQRHSDKDVADLLKHTRLKEKLDDRTIEEIQGRFPIGPQTLAALRVLRDQSQKLASGPPIAPEPVARPSPPPSPAEQAAILDEVRQYALSYSHGLPDFICTEVTQRYGAPTSEPANWRKLDELTTRLSYFQQKEDYKLILRNNTPVTNQDVKSAGGAQSFGDFGSLLRAIFEPSTEAHFEWDHWGLLRGQKVMEFAYRVALENSKYRIFVENDRSVVAAYHGVVAVDAGTHVVLRVSVVADGIPPDFPVKSAEDILDYDYQDISGHTFLLPLKATVTMNGGNSLSRNDKQFRRYQKYSADTIIKYDSDTASHPDDEKPR